MKRRSLFDPMLNKSDFINKQEMINIKDTFIKKFSCINFLINVLVPLISIIILAFIGKILYYRQKQKKIDKSKNEDIENWLTQRQSIIKNLTSKRIKLVMPGNFQLTSGFNVNLSVPSFSKKELGDDNNDPSLSGKYLIIASRNIITYNKHETIIEVATTSTANEFIPTSNPQQTSVIAEYY